MDQMFAMKRTIRHTQLALVTAVEATRAQLSRHPIFFYILNDI